MKDQYVPKGKGKDNGPLKAASGGPTKYTTKRSMNASKGVVSSGSGKDKYTPKGKGYGSGALSSADGAPTYPK